MAEGYSLTNGSIVTPLSVKKRASLTVAGREISGFTSGPGLSIDLHNDSFVYPALINIHDHMRGNYLPRVGPSGNKFYVNWAPWDNDLKSSPVYDERSHISFDEIYFLSSYKNMFSGVITVNDHFPHDWNSAVIPRLPIRVITEYTLAHECSSFDLKWGEGIEIEFKRAVEKNYPFITHLEEGFDEESTAGIEILEKLHCLDDHCVFIHCIGFSDVDIAKVHKAGAHVSWCPASNMFMFNVTCKIKKIIDAGINVSIGTDSTHTGSINLFAEMKYARKIYREHYGVDLDPELITKMVTVNPAKAFRMDSKIGSLEPGKIADVMVLKARTDDPYENLASADMEDIQLLTMEGIPLYGETRFGDLLPESRDDYTTIRVGGRDMFVKGDPAGLLRGIREEVGFKKTLDFLPFEN
jgi:5-methylthioadenosine/S-adenosylhomocysteine deaminase